MFHNEEAEKNWTLHTQKSIKNSTKENYTSKNKIVSDVLETEKQERRLNVWKWRKKRIVRRFRMSKGEIIRERTIRHSIIRDAGEKYTYHKKRSSRYLDVLQWEREENKMCHNERRREI